MVRFIYNAIFLFVELEAIRAKLESYKQLYDAGDSLPGGSDYVLCPYYLLYNTVYQDKVVPWMQEYKVLGTLHFYFISFIIIYLF